MSKECQQLASKVQQELHSEIRRVIEHLEASLKVSVDAALGISAQPVCAVSPPASSDRKQTMLAQNAFAPTVQTNSSAELILNSSAGDFSGRGSSKEPGIPTVEFTAAGGFEQKGMVHKEPDSQQRGESTSVVDKIADANTHGRDP